MATGATSKRASAALPWLVVLAGALVPLLTWALVRLELRHSLALYAGLGALTVLAVWAPRIDSALIYGLVLHIPFSIFGKWLFLIDLSDDPRFSFARGINFGGGEVLLIVAYGVWFGRVVVARTEAAPRPTLVDGLVLLFLFATAASLVNAPQKVKGLFDLVYNTKCALIYFYLSRKVERRHLPGIIAALVLGILVEGGLAMYEYFTGNVGFGKVKGNLDNSDFGEQYEVPGFEQSRAEGTTMDSHALGLFFIMAVPAPFVFMTLRYFHPLVRLGLSLPVVLGAAGVFVTYSRASWVAFAVTLGLAMTVMIFAWNQSKAVFLGVVALALASLATPTVQRYLQSRLVDAPTEIMDVRYETYWTALGIWQAHPLFGYGAGNYMEALEDQKVVVIGWEAIVHNAFLLVATETGFFGALGYFGMMAAATVGCLRPLRCPDPLIHGMALAMLCALLASLLEGLTNPTFKDPVAYTMFWTCVALACALHRVGAAWVPEGSSPA